MFQFNSFMVVIRDMLSRMESEHKTKLEQLHALQEQQRCLSQFKITLYYSLLLFSLITNTMVMHINGDIIASNI